MIIICRILYGTVRYDNNIIIIRKNMYIMTNTVLIDAAGTIIPIYALLSLTLFCDFFLDPSFAVTRDRYLFFAITLHTSYRSNH